jgi:hypothetical protein
VKSASGHLCDMPAYPENVRSPRAGSRLDPVNPTRITPFGRRPVSRLNASS